MNTNCTPGPWEAVKTKKGRLSIRNPITLSAVVYQVNSGSGLKDDIYAANARLIAATPDLLASLIELFDLLEENMPKFYLRGHYKRARAAIAKATA